MDDVEELSREQVVGAVGLDQIGEELEVDVWSQQNS